MTTTGTTPAVDPEQLLDALAPAVGTAAAFVDPPEPLDTSYGPSAFGFRISGDDVPPDWTTPLVLRLPDDTADIDGQAALAGEDAALRFCAAGGIAAPEPLALLDATPIGKAALVTSRPAGTTMLELIAAAPDRTHTLLGALGAQHAALHAVAVPDPSAAELRVLHLDDRLATIERSGDLAKESTWLRANVPAAASAVLCHGCCQPLVASGDPEAGEPITIRDWSRAVVAEPEYDLAMSVLAFWSAPFYAGTRSERAGLKMIRDMLANLYRGSYEAVRPLDKERMQYWQAFHATEGILEPSTPPELVAALRKRFKKLASGASS